MLKILIALYSNTNSCEKLKSFNGVCSDMFLHNRAVKQRDSLPTVLLAVRLSKDNSKKSINILQCADDLAIFAES